MRPSKSVCGAGSIMTTVEVFRDIPCFLLLLCFCSFTVGLCAGPGGNGIGRDFAAYRIYSYFGSSQQTDKGRVREFFEDDFCFLKKVVDTNSPKPSFRSTRSTVRCS